jgi:hypothetical protein
MDSPEKDTGPVFGKSREKHQIFSPEGSPVFREELKEVNSGFHHRKNLFDKDSVDEATGKVIDNSTYTGMEDLREVSADELADTPEEINPEWIKAEEERLQSLKKKRAA